MNEDQKKPEAPEQGQLPLKEAEAPKEVAQAAPVVEQPQALSPPPVEEPKAQPPAVITPPKPAAPRLLIDDDSENAIMFDSARFDQAQRVALTMARASITPKHLRFDTKTNVELHIDVRVANCFRIVNQALRWRMDPFAVMDKTYFVDGRMAYEAQLVVAVINSSGAIQGKLKGEWRGEGDARTVTVIGTLKGEAEPRTAELSVKQAKTSNQMWAKNPDQKLWYSAALVWARRHCPEVILGVMIEDDLERIQDQQPQKPAGTVTIQNPLAEAKAAVFEKVGAMSDPERHVWMEANGIQSMRQATQDASKDLAWWDGRLAELNSPAQ